MRRWAGHMLAGALLLAAAGCTNDPTQQGPSLLQLSVQSLKGRGQAPQAVSEAQVAALVPVALRRIRGSALMALFRDNTQLAALGEQESRGPWRTYTTTEKQTLTLYRGLVAETRGLNFDLMSSELGASAALVTGRSGGEARRIMRWLDGEGHEVATTFACRISRDKAEPLQTVTAGVVSTVRMVEICRGGGQTFTNIYQVGGGGTVWNSRQWIGPDNGYIALQLLRR